MRRQIQTLVVLLHVVEEALQRAEAPGPAEQAAVHADAQHLRPVDAAGIAFGVEHVEAVAQVAGRSASPVLKPCGSAKRMSLVSSV